jgi:glycosyltransferase involved in cell wall biosynthesis
VSARVALVIPWFGPALRGGAEQIAWQIATRLAARGHAVEVLTTTGASFQDDWGRDHHRPGRRVEDGIAVHRFRLRRRDARAFDEANRRLLAVPASALRPGCSPVDAATAAAFVRENVHAPDLVRQLEKSAGAWDAVVFLPYLYGPTLLGVGVAGPRAWLHPCLHDEAYAYLPEVAGVFAGASGLLFNAEGEAELAARLYGPAVWAKGTVVGAGVEIVPADPGAPSARAALARAGERFFLYLGRRDPTKNADLLARAFARLRAARPGDPVRLVLAGPGPALPDLPGGAVDLGLVDEAAKAALLARCVALAQPSRNESYSRVMMEAWLHGRPVVVHARCPATAPAAAASGGGLAATDEAAWVEALGRLLDAGAESLAAMGRAGLAFAREAADWERVIDRYEAALGVGPRPAVRAAGVAGAGSRGGLGTTGTAHAALRSAPRTAPCVRAIHQLLPTLAAGDAIGNHARFLRGWLRRHGWRSEIHCIHVDPRLAEVGVRYAPGALRADDGVLYHHSIGSELTPVAAAHEGPKLLVYHNVTPPEFVEPYRPEFAPLLAQGREELASLAPAFARSVGDSGFNAEELARAGFRAPRVMPIAVDPAAWDEPADPLWMERLSDGAANLLFVGRVAPNKRHEHLIALLAHLVPRVPQARLVLAGPEAPGDPYPSCLRRLAEQLGVAGRTWFTGELAQAQLQACYRTARLFVSLSEHEGFGVPLVEAMWFDVPVLAYRAGAVAETLGEGGLVVTEKRWPELAALAARLLEDEALREAVRRGQRRRRAALTPAALEARYLELVESVFGPAPGAA